MRRRDGSTRQRWSDRLAQVLTVLLLAATGAAAVFCVVLLVNPALPINPYPPPVSTSVPIPLAAPTSSAPTATPTPRETEEPARSPLPVPTALRPAMLVPMPEAGMPFSATVVYGPGALLDCSGPRIAGLVSDQERRPLRGYPVHVWGPDTDTIARSGAAPAYGPAGWEVSLPADGSAGSVWYVQLHLESAYFTYPPLSAIVRVELPVGCPQALILFQ